MTDPWNPALPADTPKPNRHLRAVATDPLPYASDSCLLEREVRSGNWLADITRRLAASVGGLAALDALDDEPLPDEPFDWSAVDGADRDYVGEVLRRSDTYFDEWHDVEYRTIARRILARVAARDPRPFRRSTRRDNCAAALVWLTLRANDAVGDRAPLTTGELWRRLGVTSCTDRGHTLRKAAGLYPRWSDDVCWDRWGDDLMLGDPGLLHSRTRRWLIEQRDSLGERPVSTLADPATRGPIRHLDDGRTIFHGVFVQPLLAVKGLGDDGRAGVMIGFGESDDDVELFGMSMPDAYELLDMLDRALGMPVPMLPP